MKIYGGLNMIEGCWDWWGHCSERAAGIGGGTLSALLRSVPPWASVATVQVSEGSAPHQLGVTVSSASHRFLVDIGSLLLDLWIYNRQRFHARRPGVL